MRRFGIHLNALRAFEAAARHSSFSRAGEELHVSHSTISHHIKGIEKALKIELFHRKNRRVVLTRQAESLYDVLNRSFDEIADTLEELTASDGKNPLRVTVTPSFANKWLIPNLKLFRHLHPEIDVQVKPSLKLDDFQREKLDIGVRTGLGNWPGFTSTMLMPVNMTPLCSPELLDEMSGKIGFENLLQCNLIHADVSPGTGIKSEWSKWLKSVGMPDINDNDGLSVQDPGLALQAAMDGLGIAMGYLELAKIDLEKGRLVQPFSQIVRHPWSYFVVVPEVSAGESSVTHFQEWLQGMMRPV